MIGGERGQLSDPSRPASRGVVTADDADRADASANCIRARHAGTTAWVRCADSEPGARRRSTCFSRVWQRSPNSRDGSTSGIASSDISNLGRRKSSRRALIRLLQDSAFWCRRPGAPPHARGLCPSRAAEPEETQ
jgi:hypothetical protein